MIQQLPGAPIWRGTPWHLRVLGLLALVLPVLVASGFAWYQHGEVLGAARNDATRSVVALEEHAANVLDTHSLVLKQLDAMTRGMSWERIEGDEHLQRTIRELTRDFKQLSVIGMADAQGNVRLHSRRSHPAGTGVSDRDYFRAQANGSAPALFIGEAYTGRLSGTRQLGISIARRTESGAFDGVIYSAVPLGYLEAFWRQFTPSGGHLVPLLRADGALLARYPVLNNPQRLSPTGPFMSHIRRAPSGVYVAASQVDGIERINAYSQVKQYPLYISFSIELDAVLREWRKVVALTALASVLAAAMLIALWLVVVRQWRQQQAAGARWQETAVDLEREVTRREQAEESLRQAQKMEAVGQLAGGIAHDFNNLLGAVMGNLQLMQMRLRNGQTEGLGRYADAAERIVQRASTMTQRLLTFSRRQPLDSRPVDVNDAIRSVHELIVRTLGPAIDLKLKLDPRPCMTLCDDTQLDNALLNLAINARDAMRGGGELAITTGRWTFEGAAAAQADVTPGEYIFLVVQDTGSGMEADVARRAFDPFFTTKSIGEGTGLGLSMVYGFVKQSGGHVELHSQRGAGTSVSIYLPALAAGMTPVVPQSTQAPRAARPIGILLVDDEEDLRAALAELLQEAGYAVSQARDGPQALEVLRSSSSIEVLVTDVGLPGPMNGIRLAKAAQELQPGLKLLFITGYVEQSQGMDELLRGGAHVMTKPFSLDDFSRRLLDLADREQAG